MHMLRINICAGTIFHAAGFSFLKFQIATPKHVHICALIAHFGYLK